MSLEGCREVATFVSFEFWPMFNGMWPDNIGSSKGSYVSRVLKSSCGLSAREGVARGVGYDDSDSTSQGF